VRPFRGGYKACQAAQKAPNQAAAGLAANGPEGYTFQRRSYPADTAMNRFLIDVLSFISYLLFLYMCIIIAVAVLSWLISFNVVNVRNQFVSALWYFMRRITEPVFQPIRNILPDLGPIDISPVIVLLIIIFIREVIIPNLQRALL
jgi:YggT family protein